MRTTGRASCRCLAWIPGSSRRSWLSLTAARAQAARTTPTTRRRSARLTLQRAQAQWHELDAHLAWCDERIAAHGQSNQAVKAAATLLGIGPVTASAVVATVGDFKQFKNGAQFGAWIGLTPRQRSSGGKNNLGGITKRGDSYLRTLLIQGAKSAVMTAHRREDKISSWVVALRERSGWHKAVVALANKNARILWAVMTRGDVFDANHSSIKPTAA